MSEQNDEPRVSVSVEMKVNLGNYESAGASLHIGNLKADTSPEEIEQLLDTGKVAYDLMKVRLMAKVNDLKGRP